MYLEPEPQTGSSSSLLLFSGVTTTGMIHKGNSE